MVQKRGDIKSRNGLFVQKGFEILDFIGENFVSLPSKMKNSMRIFLSFVISLFCVALKAQPLHFHQLTVKDGLPHNGITGLGQDENGNIWVATFGGLCYYNGRDFISLPDHQLPDKRVDRINQDRYGTMWVQCYEHHDVVSRYDTLTQCFVTYEVAAMADSVRQLAVRPYKRTFSDQRSSRVWSVEKNLLWQTDTLCPEDRFVYTGQVAANAELLDESVNILLLDNRGILWVGSSKNGLFVADTRHSYYRRIVCKHNPLTQAICRDYRKVLWVSNDYEGLRKISPPHFESIAYPMTDTIESKRIRMIHEDSRRNLWLATYDGLYIKPTHNDHFQKIVLKKETGERVYSMCEDEEGWMLIGTGSGLFRISVNGESRQVELIDSTRTFVLDMLLNRKGLWMATESGLYCRSQEMETQWFDEAARVVEKDARGNIWVGTENGLYVVADNGLQPVASPADGHIVMGLKCWRDFLWCSYNQGIFCVNIYTRQAIHLRTKHNEYFERSACLDEHTGTIFFGGNYGIDCFDADSLDEQLRSSSFQLWLEEELVELTPKTESSTSLLWVYVVVVLLISGGTYYCIRKREQRVSAIEQSERKKPSLFIKKATAIAKAHIADTEFTAEQMAQEMAMSRSKLFVLMKAETGKAAMEFVRDIRLDYAATQIKAGVPVNEISIKCGFSDPSSFRRSFARKFGMPPSQYRVSADSQDL